MSSIREKIIELRKAKGWSQAQLYKKAKIGQSTLSQIESGTRYPHTSTLQKIALALDISMAEFGLEEKFYDKSHLTKEEQSLVEKYRKLSLDEKKTIINTIDLFLSKINSSQNI